MRSSTSRASCSGVGWRRAAATAPRPAPRPRRRRRPPTSDDQRQVAGATASTQRARSSAAPARRQPRRGSTPRRQASAARRRATSARKVRSAWSPSAMCDPLSLSYPGFELRRRAGRGPAGSPPPARPASPAVRSATAAAASSCARASWPSRRAALVPRGHAGQERLGGRRGRVALGGFDVDHHQRATRRRCATLVRARRGRHARRARRAA